MWKNFQETGNYFLIEILLKNRLIFGKALMILGFQFYFCTTMALPLKKLYYQ